MGCSHQYLQEFKSYLILKNYSPDTFKSYCSSIANYFRFVLDHKGEFSTSQEYAKGYLLSRHYSGKSWSAVNLDYSSLVIFFKFVIKQKWDYQMIPRPKMAKKLPLILSFSEIEKLINCVANIKHQTILISLYATGLRLRELLNLKIENIDSDGLQIMVIQGKGNKDRVVNIPDKLINIWRRYIRLFRPEKYLINSYIIGKRYSRSSVTKIIKRARIKAGIAKSVSSHTLRHCYATDHLDYGTDIVYIKNQLGHTSLVVTSLYLHLCAHRQSKIVHPLDHLKINSPMTVR